MPASPCGICGQQEPDAYGRCSPCMARLQKRYSLQAYNVNARSTSNLLLPPSSSAPARKSVDVSAHSASSGSARPAHYYPARSPLSSAVSGEHHALSSASSRASSVSSRSSISSAFSQPRSQSASSQRVPTLSPDLRASPAPLTPSSPRFTEPAYAPMAAGFARLGNKHVQQSPSRPGSSSSPRASSELERRMFAGPA